MVCDKDSESELSSGVEEEAFQNSGLLNCTGSVEMPEKGSRDMWGYDAVDNVYWPQQYLDERLARFKWAMRKCDIKRGLAKLVPIGTFMMLWDIIHLAGRNSWNEKENDDIIRVMSFSVANASFLTINTWRETVDCIRTEENDQASYEMKSGPFIAPISRILSIYSLQYLRP